MAGALSLRLGLGLINWSAILHPVLTARAESWDSFTKMRPQVPTGSLINWLTPWSIQEAGSFKHPKTTNFWMLGVNVLVWKSTQGKDIKNITLFSSQIIRNKDRKGNVSQCVLSAEGFVCREHLIFEEVALPIQPSSCQQKNLKKQVSKSFIKSNILLPWVIQSSDRQVLRVCNLCSTDFYFHPHIQWKYYCYNGLNISHSNIFYYEKYCCLAV